MKQIPPALTHLHAKTEDLAKQSLLRTRPDPIPPGHISFCSNDYLGLAQRTEGGGSPWGAGASRLVSGERAEHVLLEKALAAWLDVEETLLFSSGYAANVGTLTALVEPGDLLVSDALNHASLIDGARLSRARVAITPHLDVAAVAEALSSRQEARAWVVTESYFGMDADSPDLRALRSLCDRHQAGLVVDEAHALGVLGPQGKGLCREAGITPDVLIGTFGKAFGGAGAFVAGCELLIQWIWNRARSFVFSTGFSPALASAVFASLQHGVAEEGLRQQVRDHAVLLRHVFAECGILLRGYGPVAPWVVGEPALALQIAHSFCKEGVHVQAIRPPTVPAGTARLRFSVTARHTKEEIMQVGTTLRKVLNTHADRLSPSL